jgi:hypothetical protein
LRILTYAIASFLLPSTLILVDSRSANARWGGISGPEVIFLSLTVMGVIGIAIVAFQLVSRIAG